VEQEVSDAEMMPTPDSSNLENAPTKKTKARKPKPASRRLSGGKKKAVASKAKRTPLQEKRNNQDGGETEEVEEFADGLGKEAEVEEVEEKAIETKVIKKAPAKRGRPPSKRAAEKAAMESVLEDERQTPPPKDRAGAEEGPSEQVDNQATESLETVTDSQIPMEIDSSLPEEAIPQTTNRQSSHARAPSRQAQPRPITLTRHRRAGSTSDTERGSDPALRRKLADMTKKFEAVQTRYTNLREVGIVEAEASFDKLKAQSQAQEGVADELIASLRQELELAKAKADGVKALSQEVERWKEQNEKLQAEARADFEASKREIARLGAALTASQSDCTALQAKLAVARSSSADVQSAGGGKTPGSAIKNRPNGGRLMVGSAEAAAQAQVAQLKEDLYSDLTGLIIRSVDKKEDETVYDCLQTGRNGSKSADGLSW